MFEPSGPLPPAVYWRRRGLAAGSLILVVVAAAWGLFLLIGGSGNADPAAGRTDTQPDSGQATASHAKARSGQPRPVPQCRSGVLEVYAEVTKPQYSIGKPVRLAMLVTNTGDRTCRANTGAKMRELVVTTSGGEPVWSSDHCHQYTTNETPVLEPGQSVRNELTWFGYASEAGCSANRSPVPAGQYMVTAKLDKLTSPPATFRLTS